MSLALIIIGLVLLVAALRGTQDDLFNLIHDALTGPVSFIPWLLALLLIGALGYWKPLRGFSRTMMALVIIVIVVTRGQGLFDKFFSAFSINKPSA